MKGLKRTIAVSLSVLMLICAMPFNAITASAAGDVSNISALKTQIDNYVGMMDGTTYVNMEAAYEKYIAAVKLYDAAVYGTNGEDVTDAKLVDAKNELVGAIANMTAWSKSTANATYQFAGDTGSLGSNVSGLLYASTPSNFPHATRITASNEPMEMVGIAPYKVVVLYDGTTITKIPVMFAARNSGATLGYDRAMCGWYPTNAYNVATDNANFKLSGAWANRYETGNKDEPDTKILRWTSGGSNGHSKTMAGYNNSTSESATGNDNIKQGSNASSFYSFANTLNYVGGASGFTNGLKTVNMYWRGRHDTKEKGNIFSRKWGSYYYQAVQPDGHIYYVIDYKSALDQISAKESLLNFNGKEYLNGDLTSLLTNFDKCTVSVTNSGYTDSNVATKASDIASTLSSGASGLSNISSVSDSCANFKSLKTVIDTAASGDLKGVRGEYAYNNADLKWTTTSYSNFKTAYENAQAVFDNALKNGYSAAANTTAGNCKTALENAYSNLAERADFTQIDTDAAAGSKYNQALAANYTYDSFLPFAQARKTVNDYAALAQATKLDTAKATEQANLDNAHSNLETAFNNLVAVDDSSKYEAFDKALQVVRTETAQTNKYSSASISAMTSVADTQEAAVYHTVTASEAGILGVAANTKLKRTSVSDNTDNNTAALLNGVNTVISSSTSYNSFSVTYVVNRDGTQVSSNTESGIAFGSSRTYTLPSDFISGEDTVKWTTVTDGGGTNTVMGDTELTKKISSNLTITADITSAPVSAGYIYKYYNANGKHVYSDTHETSDYNNFESIKPYVSMPMMVVRDWYTEVDETNKVVTVKAVYTTDGNITLSAQSGTVTNSKGETVSSGTTVAYNKNFTVTYTGNNTFWAWAVKTGNKYSVASYSSSYAFYSHCNLEFVPIYKDGSNYYYDTSSGAVLVTASTISSTPNNYFGYDEDSYVKFKLDRKAPFIGIVGKAVVEETKCRAYCLVTQGASIDYTKVGIKFSKTGQNPSGNTSTAIGNVLDTGQYSVTLSNTSYENGKFIATVNYDFPYSVTLDVMESTDMV